MTLARLLSECFAQSFAIAGQRRNALEIYNEENRCGVHISILHGEPKAWHVCDHEDYFVRFNFGKALRYLKQGRAALSGENNGKYIH